MKKISMFLLLLLLPLSSAETLLDYSSLSLKHTINNQLLIKPTSSSYYVTSAEILLSWFPRDDFRQQVFSIITEPSTNEDNDGLMFVFKKPQETELNVSVESVINTNSDYKKVFGKQRFPITNLGPEFAPYLVEQDIIDINDDISALANTLSSDKNDLFEVVFAFADWVEKNIEYDLTTLTAEAAQKSSWTLDNRRGVCDELTSLFISLNRAVGIPARFISGIAYTDLDVFDNPWGPHGWAEVYIPNIGWVPFDVTYKQFGWIDSTHIKLKESVDATSSSVNYNAKGKDFNIQGGELYNNVDIIGEGVLKQPLISIELNVEKNKTGFGSYNLITVKVTNKQNYYVTAFLQLATTNNIKNMDEKHRNIMLKPKETKNEYFIVRVADDLKKNYIYTFPLKIVSGLLSAESSFKSERKASIFDYDYFKNMIPEQKEIYSPIDISCDNERSTVKLDEPITISCEFTNNEDKTLQLVNICLETQCYNKNFLPRKTKDFEFTYKLKSAGVKNLAITAKNNYFSVSKYILINSLDTPKIKISNVEFPKEMTFENQADIYFSISQESFSDPSDIKVSLEGKYISQMWTVESLNTRKDFSISVPGKVMSSGENNFKIIISYKDEDSETYYEKEEFSINLKNISLTQKIIIFLNQLSLKLDNLVSRLS